MQWRNHIHTPTGRLLWLHWANSTACQEDPSPRNAGLLDEQQWVHDVFCHYGSSNWMWILSRSLCKAVIWWELLLLRKQLLKWTVELAQDWRVCCTWLKVSMKQWQPTWDVKVGENSISWMWLFWVQGERTAILDKKSNICSLPPGNT